MKKKFTKFINFKWIAQILTLQRKKRETSLKLLLYAIILFLVNFIITVLLQFWCYFCSYEYLGISRYRMLRNDIVNILVTRITKMPWKKERQARKNAVHILRCIVKSLVIHVPIKRVWMDGIVALRNMLLEAINMVITLRLLIPVFVLKHYECSVTDV